jgi:hypothetical protein
MDIDGEKNRGGKTLRHLRHTIRKVANDPLVQAMLYNARLLEFEYRGEGGNANGWRWFNC